MANEIGLKMYGQNFQQKVMNEQEPTKAQFEEFTKLIKDKTVKVLFYNNQVTDNMTTKVLELAKQNNIQVVGVSETMPKGMNIYKWFSRELSKTAKALKIVEQK